MPFSQSSIVLSQQRLPDFTSRKPATYRYGIIIFFFALVDLCMNCFDRRCMEQYGKPPSVTETRQQLCDTPVEV